MSREAVLGDRVPAAGNRSLLRRINALGVLSLLKQGPQTVAQLATATSLSRTASEAVVADLVRAGWVVAAPRDPDDPPAIGRPALRYGFARHAGRVASLDVGGHHVAAFVGDLQGEVVARATAAVDEDLRAADRISVAAATLREALESVGLTRDDIWALTIGSPGVISDGRVTHFGGDGMPGWIGLDVAAAFREEYACPVMVEGDCALGAVAERWIGAAKDAADVVFVLCGVRTGAAVITGGRLHRGAHGGAGLVGELPELRWRELEHEIYGHASLGTSRPARPVIFERARAGDPAALRAVDDFAEVLGLGTSAMVLAVDPELVVIGGSSAAAQDVFLSRVREVLARRCPLVPAIETSSLSGEAVGLGGLRVSLDRLDQSLALAVERADAFPEATPGAARYR